MTPYHRRRNHYVNRMAQEMQIRNLAARTIDSSTWHVDQFCSHFGNKPEELGMEEIREYQIQRQEQERTTASDQGTGSGVRSSLVTADPSQGFRSLPCLWRLSRTSSRGLLGNLPPVIASQPADKRRARNGFDSASGNGTTTSCFAAVSQVPDRDGMHRVLAASPLAGDIRRAASENLVAGSESG